mmetsp:Transcript_17034/g.42649  ORF Transcript_17034/g.42649 Transcript_17034/m.42649 type:complete len:332 (+) Transcript_17034:2453-3448(+)
MMVTLPRERAQPSSLTPHMVQHLRQRCRAAQRLDRLDCRRCGQGDVGRIRGRTKRLHRRRARCGLQRQQRRAGQQQRRLLARLGRHWSLHQQRRVLEHVHAHALGNARGAWHLVAPRAGGGARARFWVVLHVLVDQRAQPVHKRALDLAHVNGGVDRPAHVEHNVGGQDAPVARQHVHLRLDNRRAVHRVPHEGGGRGAGQRGHQVTQAAVRVRGQRGLEAHEQGAQAGQRLLPGIAVTKVRGVLPDALDQVGTRQAHRLARHLGCGRPTRQRVVRQRVRAAVGGAEQGQRQRALRLRHRLAQLVAGRLQHLGDQALPHVAPGVHHQHRPV